MNFAAIGVALSMVFAIVKELTIVIAAIGQICFSLPNQRRNSGHCFCCSLHFIATSLCYQIFAIATFVELDLGQSLVFAAAATEVEHFDLVATLVMLSMVVQVAAVAIAFRVSIG
jgi:hypothetical protein